MISILEYLLSKRKTSVQNDEYLADTILRSKAGSLMDDVIKELNRYSKESENAKKMIEYASSLQDMGFEVVWKCGYDTKGHGYLTLDKTTKDYDSSTKLICIGTYDPGYHSKDLNLAIHIIDFEHFAEYEAIMSTKEDKFVLYELRDEDFEHFRRSIEDGSLEFDLIISTSLESPAGIDKDIEYISKKL